MEFYDVVLGKLLSKGTTEKVNILYSYEYKRGRTLLRSNIAHGSVKNFLINFSAKIFRVLTSSSSPAFLAACCALRLVRLLFLHARPRLPRRVVK
jgi:hypothetical protein